MKKFFLGVAWGCLLTTAVGIILIQEGAGGAVRAASFMILGVVFRERADRIISEVEDAEPTKEDILARMKKRVEAKKEVTDDD